MICSGVRVKRTSELIKQGRSETRCDNFDLSQSINKQLYSILDFIL